ncbi:MAG: response regulator [Magnetococcales bacterium]|nr:response regulator [Magnetococcales bacterium]
MMASHKILLVDDLPSNLKILESYMNPDHELFMATDGRKALKIAAANPPDLILLDINMPDMDGFAVLEQLKANPSTQHIPVVFLTAKDSSEEIVQGLEAGAYYYLTKPFDAEILRLVIAKALQDDEAYAAAARGVRNSIQMMEELNHHLAASADASTG